MSQSARITENGQATIPKALREQYDLDPGDEIVWLDTDEGIVVTKCTQTAGRGLLLPENATDETCEKVAEELVERVRDRRERTDDGAWTCGRTPLTRSRPLA
jgi:AbrB family looped-hinge helix DNA binding protein